MKVGPNCFSYDNHLEGSCEQDMAPSSRVFETANWVVQQKCLAQDEPQQLAQQTSAVPSACMDPRSLDPSSGRAQFSESRSTSPFGDHANFQSEALVGYDLPLDNDEMTASTSSAVNDDEYELVNMPYNRLLYRCFMSMPSQECLLKEIYEWFKLNTDKTGNPQQKGWQNSIRHNLSMNVAFQKGSRASPEKPAANSWYLTDQAIENGVEPTTRFRNPHVRHVPKTRHAKHHQAHRQALNKRAGHTIRHVAGPRSIHHGLRGQSPANQWVGSRHSTPLQDEQPLYGFQDRSNVTSGVGLGISGLGWESMRMANSSGFSCTSHPAGFAPYYAPQCTDTSMEIPQGSMYNFSEAPVQYQPQPTMPQHHHQNIDDWMDSSHTSVMDPCLTPLSNTPSLDAPHLGALPSDVKPTNLFSTEPITSSPQGLPTPEREPGSNMNNNDDMELGAEFFNIGGEVAKHGGPTSGF